MNSAPKTSTSLSSALEALYRRAAHVIKLGLDVETQILTRLGNPQFFCPVIHVAGTNGKGSVCAMLESVLRAAGLKTGLYTSPHLIRFNERMRVSGMPITDGELSALFELVDRADREQAAGPEGRPATFFEFTTAMAFEHFRRQGAQVAVLETGLGGRLDATNVVTPVVSVITRLGIEHTQYLGKTLAEIAAEKSGIIKPGGTVVCSPMPEEVRDVVAQVAREKKARLILADEVVTVRRLGQDLRGQKIKIETAAADYGPLVLPLIGRFQLENVATAIAALECFGAISGMNVDPADIQRGLGSVQWPARCQVLSENPATILDVAHNPNGAEALAGTIREIVRHRKVGLVVGLLADKDCRGFMSAFSGLAEKCWAVPIHNERALPQDQLVACIRASGMDVEACSLPEALARAQEWAKINDSVVCIAGSLYLAGEVLANLGLEV